MPMGPFRRSMPTSKLALTLFFLGWSLLGLTQIRLPRLISDGMVLQRDQNLKLWGWASAQDNINISISKHKQFTIIPRIFPLQSRNLHDVVAHEPDILVVQRERQGTLVFWQHSLPQTRPLILMARKCTAEPLILMAREHTAA